MSDKTEFLSKNLINDFGHLIRASGLDSPLDWDRCPIRKRIENMSN